MKAASFSGFALRTRVALMRIDPIAAAGCLLLGIGMAGWLWSIPNLRMQTKERQHALQLLQQRFEDARNEAASGATPPQERLSGFYDALGEKDYAEQQVKALFAIAGKSGISLNQGEYKLAYDSNGRYYTYRIALPVKGSYPAIRQFCQQVLLAIPFASLDEMTFKRDAIGSSTLEAQLRFTLYLGDTARSNQAITGAGET